MLRVFIGYDSREDIAYQVCRDSLIKNSSGLLSVRPIKQNELRYSGQYWRDPDMNASTEFSLTRFLVPHLSHYMGWAIFVDCDFLYRGDIMEVMKYADQTKAVMCVKHNYVPQESTKMDGATQFIYPRKNWSSFMLFNCSHPDAQNLNLEAVNTEEPSWLHRMKWVKDENIGELPVTFNYLEGWHKKEDCDNPIAVHFTRGGPWFEQWQDVEYGDEWIKAAEEANRYV